MIYAVEHSLGASLFEARTPEAALRKARKRFGEYGAPYSVPENQAEAIASAKSLGAGVIG